MTDETNKNNKDKRQKKRKIKTKKNKFSHLKSKLKNLAYNTKDASKPLWWLNLASYL